MKLFLVALVAVVAAEPESQFFGYNAWSPYTAGVASPYYNTFASNVYGYNNILPHALGKRSADADAQLFTTPYASTLGFNGLYQPAMYTHGMSSIIPNMYTSYSHVLAKRDADADAQVFSPYFNNWAGYNSFVPTVSSAVSPYWNNFYGARTHPLGKRSADADAQYLAYAQPAIYGQAAQVNTVYKNGNFHTNLANLQKGVHNQYSVQTPVAQLYNAATPQQKYVQYGIPAAQYVF